MPIILANVYPESHVISDQWAAYATLGEYFARYSSINHYTNFVDTNDPTIYIQTVERLWLEAKTRLLKHFRGVLISLLQSHLDFFCFLNEFKYDDPFETFMRIIDNKFE